MQAAINAEMQEIRIVATLNHINPTAFAAYLDYEGFDDIEDAAKEFQDRYAGTWDKLEAWAEEHADDTGMLTDVPQDLRYYFDFAAWARDQELNGYIWTLETAEGIAIFWR